MNLAAIRHEATQEYCFCLEPGKFLFRLQTGKDDLCRVTLHSRDKYLPLEIKDTRRAVPMKPGSRQKQYSCGCLTAPKPCGKRSDSASPTGRPTRWCTRFSPLVLQTTSR